MANELHYAVLVGINRYPGIRDLTYARTDAEAFRDWLVSPEGGDLPEQNVALVAATPQEEQGFDDTAFARPKRGEVNAALARFNRAVREHIAQNSADWDKTRLYLYASGHGIAPQTSQGALLMADASRDVPGESIELALYSQWYEGCGHFRELVVLADCCRERFVGAPPGAFPPFSQCPRPYGRTTTAVGFATALAELAYEPNPANNPDDQRGYFTKAVLEGLRGGAAVDPQLGGITTETLGVYVRKTVEELTQDQQHAQILVEAGNPIVLRSAAAPARPRWKITIALRAGLAGDVELRRGDHSVIETRAANQAPWEVELEEGMYGVYPANGAGAASIGLFEVLGRDANVRL
jgi:uncharacterized caspase-like protein